MARKAAVLCTLLTFLVGCGPELQPPTVHDRETLMKLTLVALNLAVSREDTAMLEQLLYAPGDRDQKLVVAQARRLVACARFRRAAEGKLSAMEQAPAWDRLRIVLGGEYFSMLSADWQVTGNRATAELEGVRAEGQRIPPLIYVRGIWRVNLLPDGPVDNVEALAAAVNRSAELIEEMTMAISEGKLRTKEQIEAALIGVPEFAPSNYEPDLVLTLPSAKP
jgi:hypothetical protein